MAVMGVVVTSRSTVRSTLTGERMLAHRVTAVPSFTDRSELLVRPTVRSTVKVYGNVWYLVMVVVYNLLMILMNITLPRQRGNGLTHNIHVGTLYQSHQRFIYIAQNIMIRKCMSLDDGVFCHDL